MPRIDLVDLEVMLTIEDSRQEEAPAPTKFRIGYHGQDSRVKGHASASLGLNEYRKPITHFRNSFDRADERVPIGMRGEIPQNGPHSLGCGLNLNICSYLVHRCFSIVGIPLRAG